MGRRQARRGRGLDGEQSEGGGVCVVRMLPKLVTLKVRSQEVARKVRSQEVARLQAS